MLNTKDKKKRLMIPKNNHRQIIKIISKRAAGSSGIL